MIVCYFLNLVYDSVGVLFHMSAHFMNYLLLTLYSTVRSESRCVLIRRVGSDIHERLYRHSKWYPWESIQAFQVMSTSVYTGIPSDIHESLYRRSKWCPRASIQAFQVISMRVYTGVPSDVHESLYRRSKWCPRASVQVWTRLILFANTFCRSACEMLLMYAVYNSLSARVRSRYTAA